MNCEDLMDIPQMRDGLKLVAGAKGIWRSIRWIYFADCMQCLKDEVDVLELIHGEELVIVTDEKLTGDEEKIIEMIRRMMIKNIAGFVIHEGQISRAVITYCDQVDLPLYEISANLHLVDVSQIICQALVEEESLQNAGTRLLTALLYGQGSDAGDLRNQAERLGLDLSGRCRVGILRISPLERADAFPEDSETERREMLRKMLEAEFRACKILHMPSPSHEEDVIFLLPAGISGTEQVRRLLESVIKKCEKRYRILAAAGIGVAREYPEELRDSWHEAESALKMADLVSAESHVCFYEDMGVYSLIAQIPNGKFLDSYVEKRLGRLIEADQVQEGKLCDTLEAYLDHNCNANATASALYIHRNTMRYRLEKIYKILEAESGDLSFFMELKLAFAVKKYREYGEK